MMMCASRLLRLVAALMAIATLASWTTGALAHAALVLSQPADGAVVEHQPADLRLVFGEPVTPTALSLIAVGGTPQPLTASSSGGETVIVPLPPGLGDGSYLFSWRVTSIDGHPVAGSVAFAIGAPNGEIVATDAETGLQAVIWAVRALQYVALFIGVGTLTFGLFVPVPRLAATVGLVLTLSGLALVPIAVKLQGLDLLGLPLASLHIWTAWVAGANSSYSATQWALAAAFLLAALSRLPIGDRPRQALLGLAALAGVAAPVLSGHASTASPQLLTRPAVFLHMASLMFWAGALLPLALLLRDNSDRSIDALRRFSRIAPIAVGTLLVSGTTLAIIQFGAPGAGWLTPYAALFAAKLAMVALLLGLALYNRTRLTAPVLARDARASRQLRRVMSIEVALILIILAVVAGWRFTPPPRALDAIPQKSAFGMLMAGPEMGDLEVAPGRVGPVSVRITLPDTAQSGAPKSVIARFAMPSAGIEPLTRAASRGSDDIWRIDDLVLPAAGQWTIEVAVRVGDFNLTTFTGSIAIEP